MSAPHSDPSDSESDYNSSCEDEPVSAPTEDSSSPEAAPASAPMESSFPDSDDDSDSDSDSNSAKDIIFYPNILAGAGVTSIEAFQAARSHIQNLGDDFQPDAFQITWKEGSDLGIQTSSYTNIIIL